MTRLHKLLIAVSLAGAPLLALGQSLDPAQILKPAPDSWPTYSGDYTGRRFSPLTEINQTNVKNLSLAWTSKVTAGAGAGGGRGGGGHPVIVGGEGSDVVTAASIKGALIQVDGVLYVTSPDNAWALDARDGHELWHYYWKTKGGTHIGNRGVGMWHNYVYMETPDNYLICLDAKTGQEKWHKVIASFDLQYFSTMSPIVIGNHLLVGTGDDLDEPGMLQSFDPETGDVQWKWYAVPMKKGDPGADTWANIDASSHGGGNVWVPGSYDPETHLYIFGTGNPTAAYTSQTRGPGDNLYTCATVALNVDTGKMAWYFQSSPHDTHDFDSTQTPVLWDGVFNGKPRKMVSTLARNGFFFTLDRVTGEHLVTSKATDTVNWDMGIDKRGEPVRDPAKDYDIAGALVSPNNSGIVNWSPPAFSPQTGLFYAHISEAYSMYYLTTLDPRGAMGLGGKEEQSVGSRGNRLIAIDPKTGKVVWNHRYPGVNGGGGPGPGLLTTAGKLLFASDAGGNLVARDPATGNPLWHTHVNASSAPETYMLDGHQYVLVGANDTVYAFVLN
jgi:alcohol dehydrogenase (cytochrome c)